MREHRPILNQAGLIRHKLLCGATYQVEQRLFSHVTITKFNVSFFDLSLSFVMRSKVVGRLHL